MTAVLALSATGAVLGAQSAGTQAASQQSALETQAQTAANNAELSRIQADDALASGGNSESNSRMQTAGLKGSQRAALAANGVVLGEGSALDLLTSTDYMGEVDALTIRDNAAKQAWGYNIQADNYLTNSAQLSKSASSIDPGKAAGTSLLTGATQVGSQWYAMNRATK